MAPERRSVPARLADIREAIANIKGFTAGGRNEFLASTLQQYAVAHGLEIIGEAAKHIPEEVRDLAPEVPWKRIAGTRDVVSHAYHRTDPAVLWQVVENELDALDHAVEVLQARL